jgi:hypothetical protein
MDRPSDGKLFPIFDFPDIRAKVKHASFPP